jgi:hypothetical protein
LTDCYLPADESDGRFRWLLKLKQVESCRCAFGLNPFALVRSHERVAAHAVLQSIELVDDDSNKEIQNKQIADENERDEVEAHGRCGILLRLLVDLANIDAIVHHLQPALSGDELTQREG